MVYDEMLTIYNTTDNNTHTIPIIMAEYSPLLRTMLSTSINVDKDNDGRIIVSHDPYCLEQYISFLKGEEFDMNPDVSYLFDYFGHVNIYNYPLDFWEVKLYDTWLRDMCYKLDLFKDNPYYGLYEIKIPDNHIQRSRNILPSYILNLPIKHYIAGGAVLSMLGITKKYTDIDIFTTDIDASKVFLNELLEHKNNIYHTSNCVILPDKVQLILRSYSCPSEIVHGFDVGCCGVIAQRVEHGYRVFCTRRSLYSIVNRCNWIEPDRSSPSYVHRLLKYANRNAFLKGWEQELLIRDNPGPNKPNDEWKQVNINDELIKTVPKDVDVSYNLIGGFKIMLIGTDNLRFDGNYYKVLLDSVENDVINHETLRFGPIGNVNLADVTLKLYKHCDYDIDAQYHFMEQLYEDSFHGFDTKPVPLIPNNANIYVLLDNMYNILSNRTTRFNYYDETVSRTDYIDSLNYYLNRYHPKYVPTKDDVHTSLNINVNAYDLISELAIDDEEQGNVIACHSFLKNHVNPLAYIIKTRTSKNTSFYHDPASLILLQCMFGIGYQIDRFYGDKCSDYSNTRLEELKDVNKLEWKIMNPMEQLTGTFNPETIEDLEEWFRKSPLIIDDGIEITSKRYNELTL